MKTDQLIDLLAKDAGPVDPRAAARRFEAAIGIGASAAALLVVLALGVRPDIGDVIRVPMFWLKLGFPVWVAWLALAATRRMARPGARLGSAPGWLAASVAALWIFAAHALLNTAPPERNHLVFGDTWLLCIATIPLLSIPVFAAALWAFKEWAPTRLPWAGGAAGLLAGSTSAALYALHCPEMGPPFIAIWYVLGMTIPAIAGAALGPRLLRW